MTGSSTGVVEPRREGTADPHHARRWLILVIIAMAQLMVVLDATIVNIALPTAQQDLGFSDDARQWVITAYALPFGSLLLLGGRIADLFGRKRALLTGLAGFAAASALGGAATSFEMLVAARAAQGVFGALLAPATLSLLATTFTDVKERNKAFGIYGAIVGAGGAVGLLLGGALTEYADWRWCMYVNCLFAAVAIAGGVLLLRHQPSTTRPQLDIQGTVTASAGLFALVFGLSRAEDSWSDTSVWIFLAAAAVLLAVFVGLQARVAHPLLPLRVLLDRNRGGAYLTMFLAGVGMFALFLFLTYYLQQNLEFTPLRSGLAYLPMITALILSATLSSSVLLDRIGPRPLVTLGMLVAATGMIWLSGIGTGSTYLNGVLFPLIITGAGFGMTIAPSMNVATWGVAAGDSGVASATVNTAQQIGGSIGTAMLSSIAANAVASRIEAGCRHRS